MPFMRRISEELVSMEVSQFNHISFQCYFCISEELVSMEEGKAQGITLLWYYFRRTSQYGSGETPRDIVPSGCPNFRRTSQYGSFAPFRPSLSMSSISEELVSMEVYLVQFFQQLIHFLFYFRRTSQYGSCTL